MRFLMLLLLLTIDRQMSGGSTVFINTKTSGCGFLTSTEGPGNLCCPHIHVRHFSTKAMAVSFLSGWRAHTRLSNHPYSIKSVSVYTPTGVIDEDETQIDDAYQATAGPQLAKTEKEQLNLSLCYVQAAPYYVTNGDFRRVKEMSERIVSDISNTVTDPPECTHSECPYCRGDKWRQRYECLLRLYQLNSELSSHPYSR